MSPIRFPPRSQLPRSIEIRNVPLLGTTWYERGVRYWLRRLGIVLLCLLILALVAAILWGFFGAIQQSSITGFWIGVGIEVTYSLAVIVYLVVRTARRWNSRQLAPAKPPNRAVGSTGAALGGLARSGLFLGQLILVLGTLLFVGVYVAFLLAALMPETVWERPAKLELADRLRQRGIELSFS